MPVQELRRTEIAGLPAFVADGPGPFAAMLAVRVGRADERPATCGITHLVEHLAMPPTSRLALQLSASVDNVFTAFFAQGDPEEVGAFLTSTADRLRSLPAGRLEIERRILLAEAAAEPFNLVRLAYALRFGPAGQGLTGYEEWGLRRLDAAEVQAWSDERFVRGNAALWLTGPPPESLAPDLGPGPSFAPPDPRELDDLILPALSTEGADGHLLLSLLARRTHAFGMGVRVLEHRVRERLRYELGLTYGVEVVFMPLTAEWVHVALIADAAGAATERALDEALDVLRRLGAEGPTEDELEHERTRARRQAEDPHEIAGALFYETTQLLFGAEFATEAGKLAAQAALTQAEIAHAVAEAADSLLVLAPHGTPDVAGLAPYPLSSTTRVEGRRHRPHGNRLRRHVRDDALTVGDAGVTLTVAGAFERTVLFDSAAIVRRNDDGSRTLVSHDGFFVTVDPAEWRDGRAAVAAIDAAVHPAKVIAETASLDRGRTLVDAVSSAFLPNRRWVETELRALPHLLEDGEEPVMVLKGSKGWKLGLVVLTDRRVLHLYETETQVDLPIVEIRGASSTGGRWPDLVIETDGGRIKLSGLEPARHADELADRVQIAAEQASAGG